MLLLSKALVVMLLLLSKALVVMLLLLSKALVVLVVVLLLLLIAQPCRANVCRSITELCWDPPPLLPTRPLEKILGFPQV